MPFVKLDCGILNSTLWIDRLAREVFITALLMAEPREVVEEMPAIAITSLELTGWKVPPGWYGFVPAAGSGILHRARVDEGEVGMSALMRLSDPDPESRSAAFDGRRMVRVNGGFIVLNYIAYREKDATTANRSKRWRERQKQKAQLEAEAQSTRVTDTPTRVIRHQAEAEAEAEAEVEADRSNTINKLTTKAVASTKKAAAPKSGSKRPIFTGQRLTVFEWFLDRAEQTLGTKLLNEFDIHEWFFTLDTAAAKSEMVIPQRDNGAWLTEQLVSEATRRGLPVASINNTPPLGKLTTRMANAVADIRNGATS